MDEGVRYYDARYSAFESLTMVWLPLNMAQAAMISE
jgi:hypothetical protein